jgi:hypothetical protein
VGSEGAFPKSQSQKDQDKEDELDGRPPSTLVHDPELKSGKRDHTTMAICLSSTGRGEVQLWMQAPRQQPQPSPSSHFMNLCFRIVDERVGESMQNYSVVPLKLCLDLFRGPEGRQRVQIL